MGININKPNFSELAEMKRIAGDACGEAAGGFSVGCREVGESQFVEKVIKEQIDALDVCISDAGELLSCYWSDDGAIDIEKMRAWIARVSANKDGSIFRPALFIALIEHAGQMALDKSLARHLSSAGTNGGKTKNKPAADLKAWALERAKTMKGRDIDIAKDLEALIPSHLAEVSGNPRQLIYRALLARYPAKSSR